MHAYGTRGNQGEVQYGQAILHYRCEWIM